MLTVVAKSAISVVVLKVRGQLAHDQPSILYVIGQCDSNGGSSINSYRGICYNIFLVSVLQVSVLVSAILPPHVTKDSTNATTKCLQDAAQFPV